jgi:transcriptional regulator with XRE-family HTH domain
MPATADARRVAFSRFIARALEHAKTERGWSVPAVAKASGVGDSTIYRWRDGQWSRSPLPEQVVAFCDALGIPPSAAFAILWPGQSERPAEPAPMPLDPDVQTILRRLRDPDVPEREKFLIRETLRSLAARHPERASKERRSG